MRRRYCRHLWRWLSVQTRNYPRFSQEAVFRIRYTNIWSIFFIQSLKSYWVIIKMLQRERISWLSTDWAPLFHSKASVQSTIVDQKTKILSSIKCLDEYERYLIGDCGRSKETAASYKASRNKIMKGLKKSNIFESENILMKLLVFALKKKMLPKKVETKKGRKHITIASPY